MTIPDIHISDSVYLAYMRRWSRGDGVRSALAAAIKVHLAQRASLRTHVMGVTQREIMRLATDGQPHTWPIHGKHRQAANRLTLVHGWLRRSEQRGDATTWTITELGRAAWELELERLHESGDSDGS